MALAKMSIINVDLDEAIDQPEVRVLFNPAEYSIEQTNSWEAQNVQGGEPRTQFTRSDLRKLSLELFLDSYEEKDDQSGPVDVRTYTDRIARLMVASVDESEGKRPPIIQITWRDAPANLANPDFPFKGVLTSLRQQFVLFAENGCPVRAKLSVSVQEYLTPAEIQQRFPRRGSFPARTYVVRQGDTLSGIANAMWRKPLEWRRIALVNPEIQFNPRRLVAGTRLIIPAIE